MAIQVSREKIAEGRDRCRRQRRWYLETWLRIKTRDQRVIPFTLNEAQDEFLRRVEAQEAKHLPIRGVGLKPRRVGLSTIIQGTIFHAAATRPNVNGLTVAHDLDSSTEIFSMSGLFYDSLPRSLRPRTRFSGRKEFVFENPDSETRVRSPGLRSKITVATANDKRLGRSKEIGLLHCSEVAFWDGLPAETLLAVKNSVAWNDRTMIFLESTPNGFGNEFHKEYELAKQSYSDYFAFFMPWFEFKSYQRPIDDMDLFLDTMDAVEGKLIEDYELTHEQLNWRRWAIREMCRGEVDKFNQEYPSNDVECLTADTRVGTSRGMVRICDVEVGSVSDHGRVVAKQYKGLRPVYQITTKRGFTLRGTDNHLLSIAESDEFVPIGSALGKSIKLEPPVLASRQHVEKWVGFAGVSHSLAIDEVWGAWLGYFMGDGSFYGDLSLAFDGRDADVISKIGDLSHQLWGVEFRQRCAGSNGGGAELRSSNASFAAVLDRLGCLHRAPGVHGLKRRVAVPECIWRSPRPVVRAFLSNLFEADGWGSKTVPVIKFFSKHLEFTQDVQRLLLAFGVVGVIRRVTRVSNQKSFPGHELVLNARDAGLFMQGIGFVSTRKNSCKAASFDADKVDKRCPSRAMSDEVVSVEPVGVEGVWDLEIDGEPVFSANGLRVHNCFLLSGRRRFDMHQLHELLMEARDPTATGYMASSGSLVEFEPNPAGYLRIWEPPALANRYVIGADVAEGLEGGDYDCAHVWDADRLRLVAEWHGHMEPDLFGYELAKLGKIYNNALVACESNNHGYTTNTRLRNLGYSNLYWYKEEDKRGVKMNAKLGWPTNVKTKKQSVDALAAVLKDVDIPSRETISEMMSYVVDEKGATNAEPGCHDDRVMASAIAIVTSRRVGLESIWPSLANAQ